MTNALSPLRILATLRSSVVRGGTVAVTFLEQCSTGFKDEPGYGLYEASKAALFIDPGRNQTGIGGQSASVTPQQSCSGRGPDGTR